MCIGQIEVWRAALQPNYSNDTISALIEAAGFESIHTCEDCAIPGK
jgi:hypothetical protein